MFTLSLPKAESQIITSIVGTGTAGYTGDGGQASVATLHQPAALCVDGSGNVFIADQTNNVIRKVSVTGIITTVAGTGTAGFSGDTGPATSAQINQPGDIALDATGNIYFADLGNNRVRVIVGGLITTIAGNGTATSTGDGASATAATVNNPVGLAFDGSGNLYIGEPFKIRVIDHSSGNIATFAGTGISGYSGDGGPATSAQFKDINFISIDGAGNLYIADNGNHCIRKVILSGTVSTIAGTGTAGFSGDGAAATLAKLNYPNGVKADASGNVYISDAINYRVRKVNSSGIISTIAGTGTASFTGDGGLATAATLNYSQDMDFDLSGNVLFCDIRNNVIRKLSPDVPPTFVNGTSQTVSVCANSAANSLNTYLQANDPDVPQTETWSVAVGPSHGSATVSYSTTSTGSTMTPTGCTYTPTGGYYGIDSVTVKISDGFSSSLTKITFNVGSSPQVSAVSGADSMCVGQVVTFTDTATSGSWSSSSLSIATVTVTGAVTGVSSGLDSIKYTATNTCGTSVVWKTVFVKTVPSAGSIIGGNSVCLGNTLNLSNSATGGTWSSTNTGVATVNASGAVTTVGVGTTVISYFASNSCGSSVDTQLVQVLPSGIAGPITGPSTVCNGGTATYSDTSAGGTWSNAFSSISTISSSGVVTGVSNGVDTIKYSISGSCGTSISRLVISVTSFPSVNAIAGANTLCTGNSTNLTDATGGGTWSCSNGTATINSSGTLTGVSAGIDTVSYTVIDACGIATATKIVTLSDPTAGAISGPSIVCTGNNITLTDGEAGGAWSSSNTTAATISTSGSVYGLVAGSTTISYTVVNVCGTFVAQTPITVNASPVAGTITGSNIVCTGANTTLLDAAGGGTWSSSNNSVATVDASGVVHGVTAGNILITYSVNNSCGTVFDTAVMVVSVAPSAGTITGSTALCTGANTTLIDAAGSGVWSSGDTTVATVNASGVVHGVTGGTAGITYTVTVACGIATATTNVVVTNPPVAAVITGNRTVCTGFLTALSNTASGGTWISSNNTVATVSTSGVVSGVTSGTAVISYVLNNSCGTVTDTALVTVSPSPDAGTIAGTLNVCPGDSVTLTETATGGTWSSSNSALATVSAGGVVHGVSPGGVPISYTVVNSCGSANTTASITVYAPPTPSPILGTTTICAGTTSSLTNAVSFGTWSSRNNAVATIDASGTVTGVASGTTVISYVVTGSCGSVTDTVQITVSTVASAGVITGLSTVCVGSSITLTDLAGGGSGTWSTSNTAIASVNPSGVVTAASAGTVVMAYGITNSCGTATAKDTITVLPPASAGTITGPNSVCLGSTVTVADTTGGGSGTWSSSNGSIATISSAGVITGMVAGSATITYSYTGVCGASFTTLPFTVNPVSVAGTISGTNTVCAGSFVILSETVSGGSWSSSDSTKATVNSTGVVTGVAAGSATITYTVTTVCGTARSTYGVTINPATNPGTINGASSVCVGAATTLADTAGGGTGSWSSSNTSIATVSATGTVNGVAVGTTTISYSITSGCGTSAAVHTITVNPLPSAGAITGGNSVCISSSITLTDTVSGGTWGATNGNALVLSTGVVGGVTSGIDTILYTVTNSCGSASAQHIVSVGTPTSAGTLSGSSSVCTGRTVTVASTVSGGSWLSSNTTIASVDTAGNVTGVTTGSATISYILSSTCGSSLATFPITVNPTAVVGTVSPSTAAVCAGTTATLTDTSVTGSWSSSNTSVATVSTSGIVTGVSGGSVTISYSKTNSCGTVASTSAITVTSGPNAGAITGPATVCMGSSVTLSDTATGGTWTTSNASIASVNSSGSVTGVATGTATITYTSATSCGSAFTTASITVNLLASAGSITGGSTVCVGLTTNLSDAVSGGTWSSSNTAVATVSATGVVTGVSSGTAAISYSVSGSCGSAVTSSNVTVSIAPNAGAITPSTGATVCAGNSSTYSDAASGGVWSSGNSAVASVNTSGVVTGISAGATAITYTVTTGCGNAFTSAPVTVNAAANAGVINGSSIVCSGLTTSLTDTVAGGTWSSSNSSVASVSSTGVVTGVSVGTATISYAVGGSCGTATATLPVTVSAIATAGTISGPTTFCTGTPASLSETVSGGTWSSSNTAVATINSSGVVSPIANGSATITYSVSTGCGSASATQAITVTTSPSAGTLTGPSNVCVGSSISLSASVSGGIWTSSNTSIGTVNGAGNVTGIAVGSVTISYTVSNSCGVAVATYGVSVSPVAVAGTISGPATLCAGSAAGFSATVSGGVWGVSAPSIATVNTSGVVSALSAGNATISYTVSTACNSATATASLTVNAAPAAGTISGAAGVCTGAAIALTDGTSGGSWSSTASSIATVDGSGNVTGVSIGTATISYSVTNSCGTAAATQTVTVSAPAVAGTISGTTTVCVGSTTTLSSTSPGGTWNSANTGVAIVNASGVVGGVSAGSATISYTVTTACSSATTTTSVTVNPAPTAGTISGASVVCIGAVTSLTDASVGGNWSSTNTAVATVDASGNVTGVATGSTTISYTVINSCGTAAATQNITVSPAPVAGTISGLTTICQGASTNLSSSSAGGSWSSTNTSVATINASGNYGGVSAGSSTISYTVTTGCGSASTSTVVSVNPLPVAGTISGASTVCVGASIVLTDAAGSGAWSSTNTAVASVDASGNVTGLANGATTISYTVANSCGTVAATQNVTVSTAAVAGTISGASSVCAGSSTAFAESASGGTWSTSNAAVASVDGAGNVSGVSAGAATIVYSVVTGCSTATATAPITVNPLPVSGTIAGATSLCVGATASLNDTASGGTWSSSNTAVATVGFTGVVTGVVAGSTTISYVVTNGCGTSTATHTLTVNPTAVAGSITGTPAVCVGSVTNLIDASSGGVWSSSNTSVATVNSSGSVTGVSAGSAVISYTATNSCGSVAATMTVNVSAFPVAGTITGPGTACIGSTATYIDTTAGGTWSSGNTAIATVNSGGVVTGVSVGSVNIYYSVTNVCGASNVTILIHTTAAPSTSVITGGTTVCPGSSTTLTDTTAGGVWSSSNTGIATVASTSSSTASVTGVSTGTAIISYLITNSCGISIATAYITATPPPPTGTITGTTIVCPGTSTNLSDSVSGGTWSSSDTTIATVNATGTVTGVTAGTATISYRVTRSCGTSAATATVTVGSRPFAGGITGSVSVCLGTATSLADSISGGTWSSSNTGISTVSSTGLVSGLAVGRDTIFYTVSGGCGTTVLSWPMSVITTPYEGLISGGTTFCSGTHDTLTESVSGGTWSSSDTTRATVSNTGVVSAVSGGNVIISYAVSGTCGLAVATAYLTIRTAPSAGVITGATSLCSGTSATVVDTASGATGTWSSSDTSVARIGSTGLVTGVTGGSAIISYTVANSCGSATATSNVTIVTAPSTAGAIAGASSVCMAASISLSDTVSGGSWSSSDTTIATVNSSGMVTGVSTGTTTITYTITNTCGSARATATVNVVPGTATRVITAASTTVCVGSTATLSDSTTGGTWSSSDTAILSVSATGVVTGRASGAATVSYSVSGSCGTGSAILAMTVSPLPVVLPITGTTGICPGSTGLISDSTTGGSWSSADTSIATISSSGLVSGRTGGSVNMYYTVTSAGCTTTVSTLVTIFPAVSAGSITGSTTTVCAGSSITLADTVSGGYWRSADTTIATVSATGVVTGFIAGTASIAYTVVSGHGCVGTSIVGVLVHPLPVVGAISGASSICGTGTLTLSDTTAGGVWSSSNPAVATVNTSGVVTAISVGSTAIAYTVTNVFGCSSSSSHAVAVNASPVAGVISGPSGMCAGSTVAYADTITGGVWSSSNPSVATVSSTGAVTALSAGSVTLSYSVTNSCGTAVATTSITVGTAAGAGAITGTTTLCAGSTSSLTDTVAGGTWSSSNTAVALVGSTGVVNGVAAGTATITYTISASCGTVYATAMVTVNPLPAAGTISGPSGVCIGSTITLAETVSGGSWSSSNVALATVTAGGVVTGVASGVDTIHYSVTNTCGTTSAMYAINTGSSMPAAHISPASATLCGASVILDVVTTATGLSYQWFHGTSTIVGATNATLTVSIAGTYTAIISNGCTVDSLAAVTIVNAPSPIIVSAGSNTIGTSSAYTTYQWYKNGTLIAGANSRTYTYTANGVYTVRVTDANGCGVMSGGYTVSGLGIEPVTAEINIHMYPNPATSTITIESPVKVNVVLVSPDGKVVYQAQDATFIDVSNLANGMYVVMLYNSENVLLKTDKIIKVD